MISFIESADYIRRNQGKLCDYVYEGMSYGMIENLSECQKAANKLKLQFYSERDSEYYQGGCYLQWDEVRKAVWFNRNLKEKEDYDTELFSICGKGKYGKHFIKIFEH